MVLRILDIALGPVYVLGFYCTITWISRLAFYLPRPGRIRRLLGTLTVIALLISCAPLGVVQLGFWAFGVHLGTYAANAMNAPAYVVWAVAIEEVLRNIWPRAKRRLRALSSKYKIKFKFAPPVTLPRPV